MADYTTETEVRETLGNTGSTVISSEIVVRAIANATAWIKLKLGIELTTLIDAQQTTDGGEAGDTPDVIKYICNQCAAHKAYFAAHARSADQDDSFSMEVKEACKEALDTILNTGQVPGVTRSILPESNTSGYQPFADVDPETNWGFDEDRLDDVSDNRDD